MDKVPSLKSTSDWLVADDVVGERAWSLNEYQKQAEEARRSKGKGTVRQPRLGAICGRLMQRFERSYTCRTCSKDTSCVLCVDCFQASQHEGHDVLFGQSFGFAAACDCGDLNAWKDNESLGCAHHPAMPQYVAPISHPIWHATSLREIPPELTKALSDTIVMCLEFIITTMQYASLPNDLAHLPKDDKEFRTFDRNTAEPKDKRPRGPWSVIMWSDEKHVMQEMTRQIRDAMAVGWDVGEQWAREADEIGRKVMLTTSSPVTAFHTASMFQQIDLGVSLRLSADAFKEEIVGTLIDWLSDLCDSTVGNDQEYVSRLVAKALLEPRVGTTMRGGTTATIADDLSDLQYDRGMIGHQARRIDWMFQLDVRLWKKPKFQMRQIFTTIFTLGTEIKKEFGKSSHL
ncbi:hypothetical protein P7C73_g1533, partial [Tremellales sp. Uapishka_1]